MPKFHYIYLAQNLLKTRFPTSFEQKKVRNLVSDKIDLSRHVEIDLAASFRQIKSRGPGHRQVLSRKKVGRPGLRLVCDLVSDKSYDKSYDKIDLTEFGLNRGTEGVYGRDNGPCQMAE